MVDCNNSSLFLSITFLFKFFCLNSPVIDGIKFDFIGETNQFINSITDIIFCLTHKQ